MEKWIKSELVFKGRIFGVRNGVVKLQDGVEAPREVVEHPGGVGIVPFDGENVILIRQYRIAVEAYVLEIPAGKLECDDAHTTERARAELKEETGYAAGKLVDAGVIYATCGYSSELIHLYMAFDLEHIGQALEFDERIEVEEIPLAEIRRMLVKREIPDGKTEVALRRLIDYLDSGDQSGPTADAEI